MNHRLIDPRAARIRSKIELPAGEVDSVAFILLLGIKAIEHTARENKTLTAAERDRLKGHAARAGRALETFMLALLRAEFEAARRNLLEDRKEADTPEAG